MLDLKQLYKVLHYSYENRDRPPNESVCIVIVPPSEIANQYPPEGKYGEDESPPHVTVAYLGSVIPALEQKVLNIVKGVCEQTRPFTIKLGKIGIFENEKERVYHSKVQGKKLFNFRENLKNCLNLNQMQVDQKHPDFNPHVTLEYVPLDQKARFAKMRPEGKWLVDSVWLWGFKEPHLIHFK